MAHDFHSIAAWLPLNTSPIRASSQSRQCSRRASARASGPSRERSFSRLPIRSPSARRQSRVLAPIGPFHREENVGGPAHGISVGAWSGRNSGSISTVWLQSCEAVSQRSRLRVACGVAKSGSRYERRVSVATLHMFIAGAEGRTHRLHTGEHLFAAGREHPCRCRLRGGKG